MARISKILYPIFFILVATFIALTWIKSKYAHERHENDGGNRTVDIRPGNTLPVFDLTPFRGEKAISVSKISEKVIVLNFWATWCDACMEEMPSLIQLRKRYHGAGLEVVGVNLDENPDDSISKTMEKFGIDFPLFKDPDGKLADLFDVRAIPVTVIFDKSRKVLYTKDGEQNWMAPEVTVQMDRWLAQ